MDGGGSSADVLWTSEFSLRSRVEDVDQGLILCDEDCRTSI